MSLFGLFKKKERLLSLDVGSSGIKLVELDLSENRPTLVNIAVAPLSSDVFSSNSIAKTDKVSDQITALLEANSITAKRVVTAMPGPSVFTKKIKVQQMELSELASYIQMEASNFIPHNIDAVKLDYQITGSLGNDQMEVLVVAVKNEIIDSYLEAISLSGLEAAVVDVDYFALQNVYELNYPELESKTVALINIGARYSSINICRDGKSLFTGDLTIGGKYVTDTLVEELGVTVDEAEKLKKQTSSTSADFESISTSIANSVDYMASEFSRQLSFLWSASGSEGGIDKILICGGGSAVKGLAAAIAEKTEIETELLNPLRAIECGDSFEKNYLKEVSPLIAVGVGLAIRQPADRIVPDFD